MTALICITSVTCLISISMFIILCSAFCNFKNAVKKMNSDLKYQLEITSSTARDAINNTDRLQNKFVSYMADSMKKDTAIVSAINSICKGMSELSYKLLKDLILAVESGDSGKLADVVRGANHMCKQYELAEKKGADL